MPNPPVPLICAGFFLGHPGATGTPAVAYADLGTALAAARRQLCPEVHAVWVSPRTARELSRECGDTAAARVLASGHAGPPPAAVAAGFDVLGFGGDLCLEWQREPTAAELCRADEAAAAGLPSFLPTERLAARMARLLNDDDLGAPVLWVSCWRTVHALPAPVAGICG